MVGVKGFILKSYLIIPILISYVLKLINNEQAKQKILTVLLKGYPQSYLDNKAQLFATNVLDKFITPEVYSKLEYHIEHGHTIILVSANLAIYLNYWASRHKINHVIATEIEFTNDICTGKLKTRNCYGLQKVIRIKEFLKNTGESFSYSYGYGNSHGDHELLNFVDEP